MNEIPTMLGQGAFNRSLRNKVGQNKVYLYHRTRPTVSMISALFPTVSERSPSGFVHPLPCKNLEYSWGARPQGERWTRSFAFQLGGNGAVSRPSDEGRPRPQELQ